MPIGMFHCPECGEMVLAGLPHTPPLDGAPILKEETRHGSEESK
jgi:hypothetical protein